MRTWNWERRRLRRRGLTSSNFSVQRSQFLTSRQPCEPSVFAPITTSSVPIGASCRAGVQSIGYGTNVCNHQTGRRRPAADRADPRSRRKGRVPASARCAWSDLTKKEAEGFYAVHRGKSFFDGLTDFMSSGPAVVMVLEAPDAIRKWRDVMGATDPGEGRRRHAAEGLRHRHRQQRDPRLGRPGDGGVRDWLFLSRDGVDLGAG